MNGDFALDDLDLDLVSALQEAPRAPINALADAVGSSPTTVGRRLQRMHAEQVLRVIGQLDWTLVSDTHPRHVWITTAPGRLQDVARQVAEIPEAQYVAMATGRADVYCTVRPLGRDSVKDLLTQRLPSVPGVVSTQSDLVLKPFGRAEAWRIDRLDAAQRAVLDPYRIEAQESVAPQALSGQEWEATRLLHADARLTSSDLSRALGVSQSTAHRLIAGLLERQVVRPRVEVEPGLLGFHLEVALSLSTEPGSTEEVGQALGRHPSARYVSMVAGNATVIHQGVFRGEEHLADFLSHDLAVLPGIRSVEVSVVLDVLRRYWINRSGHRLGQGGFPLNPRC
ncbi:Lrp/AsnC family transcriptional regulator [Saccharopolyspora sp. WRP15-2]|uniref:Lrp/AsnC family transcriptional regulator n=1 Tax=Saccharopolyspora oryzae TaxID=2997343 RepID=A0ABT4V5M7_9PSEU|nr:Lrp/AsnC family transcriptional regulator [Saccharopolyspora oryzae]MDA3629249.1 Lrp/AsnC family transcriptional regulator [Saccharopolyspora oryzae]